MQSSEKLRMRNGKRNWHKRKRRNWRNKVYFPYLRSHVERRRDDSPARIRILVRKEKEGKRNQGSRKKSRVEKKWKREQQWNQPEEPAARSGEGSRWPDDGVDGGTDEIRTGTTSRAFARRTSEGTDRRTSSQCSSCSTRLAFCSRVRACVRACVRGCVRGCINPLSNWRATGTRGSSASR